MFIPFVGFSFNVASQGRESNGFAGGGVSAVEVADTIIRMANEIVRRQRLCIYEAQRRANRRCAALRRSVQRPKGARLSAGLAIPLMSLTGINKVLKEIFAILGNVDSVFIECNEGGID